MSLASTVAPAAIPSTSTMPKLSLPVFGRDVDVGGPERGGLVLVRARPRKVTWSRTAAGSRPRASSMSPPPTTSSRSPGRVAATSANAAAISGKPLRGSPSRPT